MIHLEERPEVIESRSRTTESGRGSRRETLLHVLVGVLVLAVYMPIQLAFLQGPQPFDPAIYFAAAVDFPDVSADHWSLRIGLIAPIRAAVLAFGPSEAGLYAVPLAAGLLLASAVYGTMLALFHDRLLAFAAALVTVLNPSYLVRSSSVFPDTVATATFTVGFFLLVLAGTRAGLGDRGRAPTVLAACAGVFFGWTYLTREFSPVLLPTVLAGVVLLRYPLHRVVILSGSALATAGGELLYGWLRYGDPLVHTRLLLARGETPRPGTRGMERIQAQLDGVLDTIVVFPRLLLAWGTGWVFLLLLGVFLAALVVRFRDRRLWILAVWCFGFWIVMAFLGRGSPSTDLWINITNIRYWLPIFPALVMGAFGGLALLVPERVRFFGFPLTALFTSVVAVLALAPGLVEFRSCSNMHVWAHDPRGRWADLRSWFATANAERYDIIWTDRATRRLVPAYTSTTFGDRLWDGKVKEFVGPNGGIAPTVDRQRSLILVHKARFETDVSTAERWLAELRGSWAPIFASSDGQMFLLASRTETPVNEAGHSGAMWWRLSTDRGIAAEPGRCGVRPYFAGGP